MAENPILALWQQVLETGGNMDAARQAIAEQAGRGEISTQDLESALAVLMRDDALPEARRLPLAILTFAAARAHPSANAQTRFLTAVRLWQSLPGGSRDLLRLKAEAAQAALANAPDDLPEQMKAALLADLGSSLAQLGFPRQAVDHLRQALGNYRRLAEAEPAAFAPDVAMTLNNLGTVLSDLGDRAGARAAYEEAQVLVPDSDPFLSARIKATLAVDLYDGGERARGLGLAREAVEAVETALADPQQAGVRHSFKGEIEHAYRLLLCDPKLGDDTLRAHRVIEALREGESLAGLGAWRSGLLAIQRTHDGVCFLASLATGTHFERGDASWLNAGRQLLDEMDEADRKREDGTREDRTLQIAAAGHALWEATPEVIRSLLASPPPGGIALSLDAQTGLLPLEFMTPTGKIADCLCLNAELTRAPGETLFLQCLERGLVDGRDYPHALVFGNPWSTRKDANGHTPQNLSAAQTEAVAFARCCSDRGFTPTLRVAADAFKKPFLQGLDQAPALVHFTGHGGTLNQEECLLFAGEDLLFADELVKQLQPFPHHPFVFLNSCLSGRARAYGGAFRGLPISFLRLGAAAVVSSVFVLYDKSSADFASAFYDRLFAEDTVAEAMQHTRRALFEEGVNCLHWGRPVLYGNPHARLRLPARPVA